MGQAKKDSENLPACDYQFIDTYKELVNFSKEACKADTIAVDIEGDSMFHYKEKVCLIQMEANGQTVVIDPLVIKDIGPIKPLLENPEIEKVIHGADYDVRSMYRDFGISIVNLFDTQLASMYMGWTETSLEAVVNRHFGIELDKKYQKKNWSRRPLPHDMVAYAASDVAYLIPLAKYLSEELTKKGRLDWVAEECRLLSSVRPPKNNDGPMFVKFKGAGRLVPGQLVVLEALLQMRNTIACQKDRPLFKIISNAALKKIALSPPDRLKHLKESKVLSEKQFQMYGKAVMEAVRKAKRTPSSKLPKYPRQRSPRVPRQVPARVKALRAWRDQIADELQLSSALLLNRALITAIAVDKPTNKAELCNVDGIHKWQIEAFGDGILEVLK